MKEIDTLFVVQYYNSWFEDDYEEKNEELNYTCHLYIQMKLYSGNLESFRKEKEECTKFITFLYKDSVVTPLYYYIFYKIFEELVECVDYLNKQKIIHRNLRPESILTCRFPSDRFLKIGDFGHSTHHTIKGRLHRKVISDGKYVAPQIDNEDNQECIEKADIFSIGKMMRNYFMLNDNG